MGGANEKPDYRSARDNTDLKHIPGSYGLPVLGKGLHAFFNFPGLIQTQHANYGDVSRIQIADQKAVLLLGADDIQRVFLDRERNFSTEMGYEKTARHFYDKGLLFRDFDEHRMQRRIMQTAFKVQSMQTYIGYINEAMERAISDWGERGEIEFYPEIKELLLRIGAKIFIGIDDTGHDYHKVNTAFINIQAGFTDQLKKEIPGTPFNRAKKGMRYLHSFFAELIPQRRNGNGTDMLSLMCRERQENGELFSDEDIILHATFLLFGAHDTTTSVLNLLMMYTAREPQLQQRLRDQSQTIGKGELPYGALEAMTEVDCSALECMRMHPTIPFLIRRTIRDTAFGGYAVPANTVLMMTSMHNHYSEQYWSMPQTFDPARFSPERAEHKSHPFAFFPFGGGAHKCIGMHFAMMMSKTFMHQLLTRFQISNPAGFEPKMEYVPLPKPAKLPIVFEALD